MGIDNGWQKPLFLLLSLFVHQITHPIINHLTSYYSLCQYTFLYKSTCIFSTSKFPATSDSISLSNKLKSFSFRNIELSQLREQPILEMIDFIIANLFYTNLAFQLLKYLLEVLVLCVFLLVFIVGENIHVHKITQSCNIRCRWH